MLKVARQQIKIKGKLSRLLALKRRLAGLLDNFGLDDADLITPVDLKIEQLSQQLLRNSLSENRERDNFKQALFDCADLPRALVQARISLGWSQSEFGRYTGMSKQQVSAYEKNYYSSISLRRFLRVANIVQQAISNQSIREVKQEWPDSTKEIKTSR
jgi:DNA-binding transcriptional regulator YiaG